MAHGCTYCTDDFHCEKFTDEKHISWCYGKDYPCKDRRISNADRIRAMTDDELAEFAVSTGQGCAPGENLVECCFDHKDGPVEADCRKCWLGWLKEEAKE